MSKGRFGIHGGQYIPETLMNAVLELEEAYNHYKDDPEFNRELTDLLNNYAGRPSRLYYAAHMTEDLGGAKVYLKREDLNHTGAHKINKTIGQILFARRMGKKRIIAETGAGRHPRSTTFWDRFYLPKRWEKRVLSQRPEPDSTVLRQRQQPLLWAWNVKSSWVKKIPNVRH